MPEEINEIQGHYWDLIKETCFNNFNGKKIIHSMRKYPKYIHSFIFINESPGFILRDIEKNIYHADMIYIMFETKDKDKIFNMIADWSADEIHLLTKDEKESFLHSDNDKSKMSIIRLWWD